VTKPKQQPRPASKSLAEAYIWANPFVALVFDGQSATIERGATQAEADDKARGMQSAVNERMRRAGSSSSWQAVEKAKQRASQAGERV